VEGQVLLKITLVRRITDVVSADASILRSPLLVCTCKLWLGSAYNVPHRGRSCWAGAKPQLGGADRSLHNAFRVHQPFARRRLRTSGRRFSLPRWRECTRRVYEASATIGFLKRFEVGYTRAFNSDGSVPSLSPLFNGGFNIFHGKANVLAENAGKHNYIPAISLGFVARTNVRRVGGVLDGKDTHNEDFYLVATKTITYFKVLPIVANFGIKATNASVLGIAGNAPYWQGRLFGTVGFVVPGPVQSKIIVGSEFMQEPRHIAGLPGASLPTVLTYFARVIPRAELPLNVDFGVAQVANNIAPGVDLHVRSQFALGASYRF